MIGSNHGEGDTQVGHAQSLTLVLQTSGHNGWQSVSGVSMFVAGISLDVVLVSCERKNTSKLSDGTEAVA